MLKVKQTGIVFIIIPAIAAILSLKFVLFASISHATSHFQDEVLIPPVPMQRVARNERLQAQTTGLRGNQWPLRRIGIPDEVNITSIPIAIADSGGNILPEFESSSIAGGWNFYDNNGDYSDVGHHGTALLNTLINSDTGGARRSQVYIYRISDRNSNMSVTAFSKAVNRAVEDGVKIILCAWGTRENPPDQLKAAVKKAREHGILIISAAADEGLNADIIPDTWDVQDSNVIRVTATAALGNNLAEDADSLDGYADSGHSKLDLAAPGQALDLDGSWDIGTSIAVPWTGIVAAMIWAQNPDQDWRQVRRSLLDSVVRCPKLEDKVFSEGRLSTRALDGQFNEPLDTVSIKNLRLKKQKKLSFTLEASMKGPTTPTSPAPAVYRVYAGDILIGIMEEMGAFFTKVKPGAVTSVSGESSHGGRDQEPVQK